MVKNYTKLIKFPTKYPISSGLVRETDRKKKKKKDIEEDTRQGEREQEIEEKKEERKGGGERQRNFNDRCKQNRLQFPVSHELRVSGDK